MQFQEFLEHKSQMDGMFGFEPTFLPECLFPFQSFMVTFALKKGRSALFEDCGTGKSLQELVWSQNVYKETGKPVLNLTPLAVSFQTEQEAHKFGIDAEVSRDGKVPSPITITNYDRLHLFNPEDFGGVVCDESSAIKSFDGARRNEVTAFMRKVPYRLLGTATAAPNDYIELGTSSEALGCLGYMDMLSRFFVCDQRGRSYGNNEHWRFKGHAQESFWKWVASWARAMRKPSDLGFDDAGFDLPELKVNQHIVQATTAKMGSLFDMPAANLQEWREEQRRTIVERCEMAATLANASECSVAWCQLNDEGDLLIKLICGAVQVSGSDTPEEKEEKLSAFSRGQIRVLVTKPSIGAWGLNWQHCNHMTFFPSYSYEQYYQAVRRSWRFGQKRTVTVGMVTTEGGEAALKSITRKAVQADQMFASLVRHMTDAISIDRSQTFTEEVSLPSWAK